MMKLVRTLLVAVVLVGSGVARAGELWEEDPNAPAKEPAGLVHYENGQFNMDFHMRIQAWGGWVANDASLLNGDRMQETGFMLRRARFGVDGEYFEDIKYNLEMDLFDQERAGGPLYAAWVAYTPSPWFAAKLGVQAFPYLKGQMISSGKLPHLDRSVGSNAMSPENSMGLTLKSEPWADHLKVTLGLFNGLRAAPNFFGGYEGVGVSLGNRFEELAYAGRIDLIPLDSIGCGVADLEMGETFRLALGGAGFYNDGQTIMTYGYSAYLHMKWMGLHLFAEFAQDNAEPQEKPTTPNTAMASTERRVITGSLGYMLLYNALGVAVRAELLDDNLNADNQGDELQITGTLTAYMGGDDVKLQVEYTHREELHGVSLENDAVMGGVQLLF